MADISIDRRQAGFVLAELTLALILMTLLAVWGVQTEVARARDAAAQAAGTWLVEIRHGVYQYLGRYFDDIEHGRPLVGKASLHRFDNALSPTVDELKRAGHLPSTFPAKSALGFGAQIQVFKGTGCPGDGCRLDALVVSDSPLLAHGREDDMGAAAAIVAMQGWGARVSRLRHDHFTGPNVSLPNIGAQGEAAWPIGTLAAWAGLDRASTLTYLRVGDARDPEFKNNVTIAGRLEGDSVLSRSDIRAEGSVSGGRDVVAGGSLVAHDHIELRSTGVPGSPCARGGVFGRDGSGQIMACVSGTWQTPTDGFGGAFGRNTKHGCQMFGGESMRNPRTGDCSCPVGYAEVPIAEGGRWYERGGYTFGYVCIR